MDAALLQKLEYTQATLAVYKDENNINEYGDLESSISLLLEKAVDENGEINLTKVSEVPYSEINGLITSYTTIANE
jgi:hypothetical protein